MGTGNSLKVKDAIGEAPTRRPWVRVNRLAYVGPRQKAASAPITRLGLKLKTDPAAPGLGPLQESPRAVGQ
jgi:hypothetical protein